jgi:outer membrane protein assembly factor BamA
MAILTSSMRLSLCFSALLLAAPAPAQQRATPHATEYTIKRIVFQGTTPYSQPNLEAAAGLHPGAALTQAGLQSAAERLIDTGAFSDVQASLDGPVKAIDVVFKVQPTDSAHLLHASFGNLVWWQPDELTAELQKQVPLFNGSIPEGGNQQQAIETALHQLLTAKGINATVTSELIAPFPGQPLRLAEFRIQQPDIFLHSLTLTGVSPAFSTQTDQLSKLLTGTSYNEGLTNSGLQNRLLDIYHDAGYQEATITSLTRTITSATPSRVEVNVAATIHEGLPDHLSSLNWPGSPVMTSQAFTAAVKIHPGDLAAQQPLRDSLTNLDAAYRNHGYMDVIVDAHPTLDATNHQVAFTVTAVPGPQYRLRNLTVLNLSPSQRKEFDATWKLHKGDIYDAGYVTDFLKNNTALHTLAKYSASFNVVEDPEAATLDLTITFRMSTRAAPTP